ncbi:bacillithiol system redox-active protein YtxJ [Mechercharimyces sp. CAU 1602]|uniref:bacillithiol system redox-active protein YtxJ n=1 Tax=Mechercharimyces sp. CAU 1602 TaxID=2973933 RepID=UPI002162419B|nr:bacillithiol system redox-active protein YtxJ [Mechercharimyces sp. CAU 1602]MCS1350107.1 bacillithiol system redox-active protein YtxJ [Mechercharimyces sp. CAU 1602]
MVQLNEIKTIDEWHQFLRLSNDKDILIFKHSTACPISHRAYTALQEVCQSDEASSFATGVVKVIEDRDISNEIEVYTGIQHQSPQIFLIRESEVLWSASHGAITVDRLWTVLQEQERMKG